MKIGLRMAGFIIVALGIYAACTALAAETPKRGGTLTYLIPTEQRVLMRQFEKHVMDDQAHESMTLWWYRIVPYRSYVKGWHISPSHFLGNDPAKVWLDE